jgi:hypothetical protein
MVRKDVADMSRPLDRHRKHWTDAERARLEDLLDAGVRLTTIAAQMGRTVDAIEAERLRAGFDAPTRVHLTVHALAQALGVDDLTVRRWVAAGYLRPRRAGRGRVRVVDREDVLDLLADERFWQEVDPRCIVDPTLRAWAMDVRGDVRFFTPCEAARRLALTPSAVYWRIRRGFLRAVRRVDGAWMVRSDWLSEGQMFTPPRPTRQQRFTPDEDAFLRLWRPVTPICDLARALDRWPTVVEGRCRRLGLEGPTVPHPERVRRRRPEGTGVRRRQREGRYKENCGDDDRA